MPYYSKSDVKRMYNWAVLHAERDMGNEEGVLSINVDTLLSNYPDEREIADMAEELGADNIRDDELEFAHEELERRLDIMVDELGTLLDEINEPDAEWWHFSYEWLPDYGDLVLTLNVQADMAKRLGMI